MILSVTSLWMLLCLNFKLHPLKSILCTASCMLSTLYWYNPVPKTLLHTLDRNCAVVLFVILILNNTKIRFLLIMSSILYFAAQRFEKQATWLHLLFRYFGYITLHYTLCPTVSFQQIALHSALYFGHILYMSYKCYQQDVIDIRTKDFNNTLNLVRFQHILIILALFLYKYTV